MNAYKWLEKGIGFRKNGDLKNALKAINMALHEKPELAEAHFERGIILYRLGNRKMAAECMDAATLLGYGKAGLWSRFEVEKESNPADKGE